MTTDEKIIKTKVGLLRLAEQLGNVSLAGKVMGYSRERSPLFKGPYPSRDPQLIQIETCLRQAIRDAVNQGSRKPFTWGGLIGYQQLRAIAKELSQLNKAYSAEAYLLLLKTGVEFILAKNHTVAEDLYKAHQLIRQAAGCLHYPPDAVREQYPSANHCQVTQEMERLIQETHSDGKVQRVQIQLLNGLQKRWQLYGCQPDAQP